MNESYDDDLKKPPVAVPGGYQPTHFSEDAPLMAPGGYQPEQGDPQSQGYLQKPKDETIIQVQDFVSYEQEEHLCGLAHSPHTRGWIFNGVVWAVWLYFIVIMAVQGPSHGPHPGWILAVALLPVCIIGYWIEAFMSGTSRYLWNFDPHEDIISYVQRLRTYAPVVKFWCECYHYRTYTTTSTDSKGNTTTQTHTERVVTHREEEIFTYSQCLDSSGDMNANVFVYNATRVDFFTSLQFGDIGTANCYKAQKDAFVYRNQYRDTHFDFAERTEIRDFVDKKMSIVDPKTASPFLSWGVYAFCTVVLFCSAPYRLWMDRNSIHAKFTFIKQITK